MDIGGVHIESKLALAPMAGVTDLAFRTICREAGAGYTYTEMVSAKALCFQDQKTLQIMELGEGEHPSAVQIFGFLNAASALTRALTSFSPPMNEVVPRRKRSVPAAALTSVVA